MHQGRMLQGLNTRFAATLNAGGTSATSARGLRLILQAFATVHLEEILQRELPQCQEHTCAKCVTCDGHRFAPSL